MLKTRNGKETPEIKEDKKGKARQEAEAARVRARQQNEAEKNR